ncbi:MAG: ribonuclease HII [Candidatus Sungbacteria bacterium]|nr:ribonuclease HII [Candidatus Sungbacteria bacterium]
MNYIIGIDEAGRAARKRASFAHHQFIIGIDEAGRGPLAGPVVVAGIKIELRTKNLELRNIRDSKKLTARQREEWFRILTNHPKIEYAVAKIYPKVIDRINISQAANLGVLRVCRKLSTNNGKTSSNNESRTNIRITNSSIRKFVKDSLFADAIFLDGGLKLPRRISHEVIIKGDEKIPAISAASIIAKVTRDRLMFRLHKKYPKYRFDLHKGYGTKLHYVLIRRFGHSVIHRKSFRLS